MHSAHNIAEKQRKKFFTTNKNLYALDICKGPSYFLIWFNDAGRVAHPSRGPGAYIHCLAPSEVEVGGGI